MISNLFDTFINFFFLILTTFLSLIFANLWALALFIMILEGDIGGATIILLMFNVIVPLVVMAVVGVIMILLQIIYVPPWYAIMFL